MVVVAAILARIPLFLASGLAWILAWTWWCLLPFRRDLAIRNLKAAIPEESPGPTLRKMMQEFLLSLVEALHHERRALPGIAFEGWEPVVGRMSAGKGTLVLTGHAGAWELMAMSVSRELKIPVTLLARIPGNPGAEAVVRRMREACDLEIMNPDTSAWEILDALKRGRLVAILLDQRHNQGFPVPFFGRPAWTTRALSVLAARSRVPVFCAWAWRQGLGKHQFELTGPLELCGDAALDARTCMAFYEDQIRRRPHAWLWLHDRWKEPSPT